MRQIVMAEEKNEHGIKDVPVIFCFDPAVFELKIKNLAYARFFYNLSEKCRFVPIDIDIFIQGLYN